MQDTIWAMQWDHQKPEEIQGCGPAVPWKPHTKPNVLAGKSNLKAVTKFCSLAIPTQQETEKRESHMVTTTNTSFQAVAVGAEGQQSSEELLLTGSASTLGSTTEDRSLALMGPRSLEHM